MPLAALPGVLTQDDPVLIFAAVMVILLLAPFAFERLRVPGMVGLIVAGLILGPHGLGFFKDNDTFRLLATVGLLYLMFLAGLEINLNEFKAHRAGSLLFGSITFLIPQVGGVFLAKAVIPGFSWMQSVLLASMFASHTLLSHPIASRLGLAKNRAVVASVGGTILTDTAALLVLAMIAKLTQSALTPAFIVQQVVLLLALGVVIFKGLPRLGYWFFRDMDPDGAAEFIFVLAGVFLAALGAMLAGIEPIIGAFLAGLALSPLVPEHGVLRSRLEFTGHALFIPFFLLSVGMLVDPRIFIGGWGAWGVAAFMCVTVVACKYLSAVVSARLLGMSRDEGMLIFGLTVNQAAATLAAALVGRRLGLLDDTVLNGTVMMILVTCILGPWVTQRFGRRVALTQQAAPPTAHGDPHTERVLVTLGSPRTAERLLDLAILLRGAHQKQPVYALHVVPEGGDIEAGVNASDRVLAAAMVHGSAAGVTVQGVTRIEANPAAGILRAVRELRATTLVLGWGDRNPARVLLFRSLLDRVLSGTRRQTLLICRAPYPLAAVRRVVVVVPPLMELQRDVGSGLRTVTRLATRIGATVEVFSGEHGRQTLQAAAAAEKTKVIGGWARYDNWEDILGILERFVATEDMLVLVSPRSGQLAWDKSVERLPSLLARRFPAHNAVVVYPPDPDDPARGDESLTLQSEDREAESDLERAWACCAADALTGGSGPVQGVIAATVRRRFGGAGDAERVVRALLNNEAVEIAPGVLLLHAHIEGLDEAALLLASGRFEQAGGPPARVIVLLASPLGSPPEEHLRLLAAIARLAQDEARVARLATARDSTELRDALRPTAVVSAG